MNLTLSLTMSMTITLTMSYIASNGSFGRYDSNTSTICIHKKPLKIILPIPATPSSFAQRCSTWSLAGFARLLAMCQDGFIALTPFENTRPIIRLTSIRNFHRLMYISSRSVICGEP
uniref:Secreted protein n=1 Tax=Caenorhabditis japonica TaxID=281687 RepID=A0A8R1E7D7_CAEJA